jgi:hypothetical protein
VVLTEAGWVTAYTLVGEMTLELATGDRVILPPSSIFFVPCPGWVGLLVRDLPVTADAGIQSLFSTDVDVMSQPTLRSNMTQG